MSRNRPNRGHRTAGVGSLNTESVLKQENDKISCAPKIVNDVGHQMTFQMFRFSSSRNSYVVPPSPLENIHRFVTFAHGYNKEEVKAFCVSQKRVTQHVPWRAEQGTSLRSCGGGVEE